MKYRLLVARQPPFFVRARAAGVVGVVTAVMWRCVCDAPRYLSRRCAQVFAHVQGTDEGIRPKPAPDVILAALEKAQMRDGGGGGGGDGGGAVFYVGDTERDVLAARAAGARPISVCQTAARDEVRRRVVVGERGRAAPRRASEAAAAAAAAGSRMAGEMCVRGGVGGSRGRPPPSSRRRGG